MAPRGLGTEQFHPAIVVDVDAVHPLHVTDPGVFEDLGSLVERAAAFIPEDYDGSLFAIRGDDVLVTVFVDITKDRRLAVLSRSNVRGDRARQLAVLVLAQCELERWQPRGDEHVVVTIAIHVAEIDLIRIGIQTGFPVGHGVKSVLATVLTIGAMNRFA